MCTGNAQPGLSAPGSVAEALAAAHRGVDYLNAAAGSELDAAAIGDALVSLGVLRAKFTAAHAGLLRRFDAADAHDADGYGSSVAWLAAMAPMSPKAAKAAVRQMRQLGRHRLLEQAMACGQLPESWFAEIEELTRKFPAGLRDGTDAILLEAAAAGASLDDLKVLAWAAYTQWKAQSPDPDDDDGFDDRYVQVGTTFGGAACIRGNLTPECGAAVQAVLEALGKRQGPEDARTEGQCFHDALQLGCELLIRARMVPARAGADTQVITHIALGWLRQLPGASAIERAWLGGPAEPGFLAGQDAEAAACDAMVVPVVTGHADMQLIDKMIDLALATFAHDRHGKASTGSGSDGSGARLAAMSPAARDALRYAVARLAIDFLSGPGGLAAALRTGLLPRPYGTASLPLDIGYSDTIPAHIRRAVQLRDKGCAWPRCGKPAAHCDVHHIVHKKDGGRTSVGSCLLLCQFHHDVCIHRWGWRIVLHPDGSTSAYGPDGQALHSHSPPTTRAG